MNMKFKTEVIMMTGKIVLQMTKIYLYQILEIIMEIGKTYLFLF